MAFISYAQNFEDVMLYRAFKEIDCGYYIDVGAQDPKIESVTRAFYERGWHGINIEPVPVYYAKLQQNRPKDINLAIVAGDRNGEQQFFEIVNTGLSTLNEFYAKRYEEEGGYPVRTHTVHMQTLDSILADNPLPDIHFLKIDAEGAEEMILRGLDLQMHRPWVILIEATEPNSKEQNYISWEKLLLSSNYHFVYFDGLNRFYVANEKQYLDAAFSSPPNVWDNFEKVREDQPGGQLQAVQQKLDQAQVELAQLKSKYACELDQAQADLDQAQADLDQTRLELTRVYSSRSWRITSPLRFGIMVTRSIIKKVGSSTGHIKILGAKVVKYSLRRAMSMLNTRPKLNSKVSSLVAKFPRLESRLRRLKKGFSTIEQPSMQFSNVQGIDDLPPTARQVYEDLKAALREQERKR